MNDNNNNSDNNKSHRHFVVVVMGDVGRSPRMQYHALSLLEQGCHVSLVGYSGEDLIPRLQEKDATNLNVVRFNIPTPTLLIKVRLLYLIWRIISMCLWLCWALFISVPKQNYPPVDCILVQNPPALPLLLISYIYAKIKKARMVIDWHNLGYSMLNSGTFRKLAKVYEFTVAPLADAHLCVTNAMKIFLQKEMNLNKSKNNIRVLYDCPSEMFIPITTAEQHDIMKKLNDELYAACPRSWNISLNENRTIFTQKDCNDGSFKPRHGRPALCTSSTSWTEDEDFGVLLEALIILDQRIERENIALKVLVVVTGKGPQKAFYEEQISRLKMIHVAVQTVWLEPGDYPRLLACADVGVSLHTSTSGLDLPMKILDLFGCCVPVCARNFDCLSELVEDGKNGRIFDTANELSDQLRNLLCPLTSQPVASPHSFGDLLMYSKNLQGRRRWRDNWVENALPVLFNTGGNIGKDNGTR